LIVLSCINVVGVILRVVYVFLKVELAEGCGRLGVGSAYLWSVNTKTFFSDLEFASGITEAHEGEDPDKNTNCAGRNALESADVYSLTVVTEPITKVDALQVMIISTWTVLV